MNWTEGPPPLRPKKWGRYTTWDVGDMTFRYGFHVWLPDVPENKRPKIVDGMVDYTEPSVCVLYDLTTIIGDDPEEIG